MKLNRTQFKKILKECIRELIMEGAFDNVIKENVQVPPTRMASNDLVSNGYSNQSNPQLTNHPFAPVGQLSPAQRLRELAKLTAVHSAQGDSKQAAIMENIFADTAMTTLQQQLGTEMGGSGEVYLGEQENPAIEERDQMELNALSGGRPKNHWAALAFGKYEKK